MRTQNHGGMISTGETPDSSTRALWQSYSQFHLLEKQEGLAKEINIVLRSTSFIFLRVL
jgi:hypothetical protein